MIQRRKAQALLFYLAVAGEWRQRATLAALFWPESNQQRAQGSLRRHLSELNTILGSDWLETRQDAVRLARAGEQWIDVHEFQRLLAKCHEISAAGDSIRCIDLLTAAVALYRADFLEGFSLVDASGFDEWQSFQTEELRLAYGAALDQLIEALPAQNRAAEAIPYARRRLSLDSLHEPAHRQLMQLYAVTGQQAAALHQYRVCVQTLQTELDVPPAAETTALYERIRQGELATTAKTHHAVPAATPPIIHNLPASTTPFVGRSTELADLIQLCRDPDRRLITLLGPGGIGKTRLSLEVAAHLVDETPDGVFFVRLAQLSDPANMVSAIADAMGFQFQADGRSVEQQLFAYLHQRQPLLVLDNFEHLMAGVTFIQELLQSCPRVHLLVTSRERLKLTGETAFTLSNLDFPPGEPFQQIRTYSAVQLFVETAQRVRPTEALQDDDMRHVARICRMVGGMPLGIILAAAWIGVLSPETIASELTRGLDLLDAEMHDLPERQRNMRVILAYSWERLTPAEQSVFMRLAVFRGGFTLDAVRVVAGATLPTLVRLVDKSFVHRTAGNRYDIHELLRQYAKQQLDTAGIYPDTEEAHGEYYLTLLRDREPKMAGSLQQEAIREIEEDFENIRGAWQWAVSSNQHAAVDRALDGLFRWFWLRRTRQREALDLLRFALESWAPVPGQAPHPVWGRMLARSIEQQGPWLLEPAAVRERVNKALAIARGHRNQAEETFCKWVLALTAISEYREEQRLQEMQSAIGSYEDCARAYRAGGDSFWLAHALELLGHGLRQLDQHDRAIPVLEESLSLRQTHGDRFGMARSLREIAWVRFKQGMEQETLAAAESAYDMQRELGDQQGIADSRFFLALSLLCRGDWRRAKELIEPVKHFAGETDNTLYQKWAFQVYTIATCMEENMQSLRSTSCSFPNEFNHFSMTLMHVLFSNTGSKTAYSRNVRKLLRLSTSDREMAVCLPFAADLLSRDGHRHQAVALLALAYGHTVIAKGWIGLLPGTRTLKQSLRDSLTPAEFEQAWQAGRHLDLRATVTALCSTDRAAESSSSFPIAPP